ncbi:lysozyme C, milk isozyme-like [Varanus komodoensis]|uniref:lysozyme C, milk isozyme-like n=1 Tax=Varanus komodoensis TaxID=61221 RepID=UPI001CF78796|nr:lysozyme C, milk isozyme-like [Varanus komodoensis]
MNVLAVALISIVTMASEARIIPRCELAKTLKEHGLDGFKGYTLKDWLCMVFFESNFNTRPPMTRGTRRQGNYGIFRFSNRYWCSDGKQRSRNVCNIACQKFLDDDITDDIECAKKVVRGSGLNTWSAWTRRCRGKNLDSYLKGCSL